MLVFASLTASLHMVARVVQGACPPDTPMWYQQQCNAEAAAAAVPQEALLTLVVGVLVWQVLFPGATRHALVLAWATAVVATNVCMRIAGSNLYLWNNLGFALVLAVSYEIERFKVNAFIARRLLTLSTELTQAVEASREGIQVERDQQLSVSDELRNTIANAAHDLTSPCTAVGLAVESILENLLQSALRERRTLSSEEARMSDVLWDVYYAMATLHMIINRATDYNKMTATVALKPTQRPTNIRETVHRIISGCGVLRVHGSISKQYSSNLEGEEVHVDNDVGVISLAPISNDVPDVGMTDESWLRDNLLCVVSNAVKYSTGSVHIYIKAVTASGKKMVEIAVQDSGPEKLTSVQLKALFDRPIQFSRESVGGMGVGMYCLIQRSKALGGDAGARLRADNRSGTVVWFRFPYEPCPENLRAIESGLFALRKTYMDTYAGVSAAHSADNDDDDSDHGELHGLGHTKVKKPSGLLRLLSQKISNSSLAQSVKSSKQGPDVVATSPHPSPLVRVKKGGQAHVKPSKDALPAVPEGSTMVPISDTLNASDGPLSGLHILAVDDSAAILKMMVRMLSGAGAVVSSAKDGREAVDLFKAAAFDVVVTDIQVLHIPTTGYILRRGITLISFPLSALRVDAAFGRFRREPGHASVGKIADRHGTRRAPHQDRRDQRQMRPDDERGGHEGGHGPLLAQAVPADGTVGHHAARRRERRDVGKEEPQRRPTDRVQKRRGASGRCRCRRERKIQTIDTRVGHELSAARASAHCAGTKRHGKVKNNFDLQRRFILRMRHLLILN